MNTFLLEISEEQRVALLALVRSSGSDADGSTLEHWVGMLEELPAVEAASPGILHGFCR